MLHESDRLAHEIAEQLTRLGMRIVFAESCTGGLLSATLARIPGISNVHCGSAVVYRLDTKTQWLGIEKTILVNPGAVSEPVARLMAEGVLKRTPEASIAASITGHLGPNAPAHQDGLIYVGIAIRDKTCRVLEHRLPKLGEFTGSGEVERLRRLEAAAEFVLVNVAETLRPHLS